MIWAISYCPRLPDSNTVLLRPHKNLIFRTKIHDSAHTFKCKDEIRGRVNLKTELEFFLRPNEKCYPQVPIDSKYDNEPFLSLLVGSSKRKKVPVQSESSVVFTVNIQNHTKGMEFQIC